ncbi:hypothetical protein M3J09_011446 [Ascochyta lentis]
MPIIGTTVNYSTTTGHVHMVTLLQKSLRGRWMRSLRIRQVMLFPDRRLNSMECSCSTRMMQDVLFFIKKR